MLTELQQYNPIHKRSDEIFRRLVKSADISSAALWVLYAMRALDRPCTQIEVCENLFLPKQTVNSVIKMLVRDGHIEMRALPKRREKLIELTDSGRELAAVSADRVIAAEEGAFLELDEERRRLFLSIFADYVERLSKKADEIILKSR